MLVQATSAAHGESVTRGSDWDRETCSDKTKFAESKGGSVTMVQAPEPRAIVNLEILPSIVIGTLRYLSLTKILAARWHMPFFK